MAWIVSYWRAYQHVSNNQIEFLRAMNEINQNWSDGMLLSVSIVIPNLQMRYFPSWLLSFLAISPGHPLIL